MQRKQDLVRSFVEAKIIDDQLTAIGVMDFDGLQKTVEDVKQSFPNNFQHTFAVKANPMVMVLNELRKNGMGAEVASPGELKIALAAGYLVENIIYDSPAKTMADLRGCLKNNISVNIDNVQELHRIDKLMMEYPDTKSIIGFRINPQIGSGNIESTSTATATSKFGYALADGDNRNQLIEIYKERPWLKSVHTHSGSQGCSLDLMAKGVLAITELAEAINAQSTDQQILRIDVGGGLPVNFSSEEVRPTFNEYADVLKAAVPILFTDKYIVKTEFGRAIVAKNGIILTKVEYTKNSGGRHIATTHTGAQILTRTSFLPNSWPLRVSGFSASGILKTSINHEVVQTDVAGPCCFAGDLICANQPLPKLEPNDFVMVHDVGGYYFSNHFDYNCFPKVAVYAISGSNDNLSIKCIRTADTLDDVLAKM